MNHKRSFFEKLTGAVKLDEEENDLLEVSSSIGRGEAKQSIFEDDEEEGQLTVDVYQTPTEVVIKTMVAGVKPEDLDVSISRDAVTIHGRRAEDRTVSDEDYFHQELYWGAFSRTVVLPEEIDVDEAEASEKFGMLTLRLPKLDKNRQTKLKVKAS